MNLIAYETQLNFRQFLGMAAHDLLKPVSAVVCYSEFLLDETAEVLSAENTQDFCRSFLNRAYAPSDR